MPPCPYPSPLKELIMPYPHIKKSSLVMIAAAELAALLIAGAATGLAVGIGRAVKSAGEKQLRAEKEKQRAKREKIRNDLLRSAAHDIRTPLYAIRMLAGLLSDSDRVLTPEEHADMLQMIKDSADELTLTAENIITLTGSGMADQHLKMQSVPAAEIVSECVHNFRRLHDGVAVSTYVPDDQPEIMMDAQLIKRVMQNLLENAVKHGQASAVDITVKAKDGFAEFRFRDNGKGISESALGNLFKEQPENGTGEEKSMGVGLSLCKTIAELHGGTIRGGNIKGGAEFAFTIPLYSKRQ